MLRAMALRFVLNGEPIALEASDPRTSLLQWLRDSGRTGSKEGCAEGECGACAVAMLQTDAHGRPAYRAINSCLVPLASVAGREVVTVEGVTPRDGTLHPVQRALIDTGGSQCGYCTPGFVISLFCEHHRPGRDGYDPAAISGNLCRCTGYRPIADAARALAGEASQASDAQLVPLRRAPTPLGACAHEGGGAHFVRPDTLDDLLAERAAYPDALLLSGGTDVMVDPGRRAARPTRLLSLEGVRALAHFTVEPHALSIGAGLTLSALEEHLAAHASLVPMLRQLLPLFSSRLIKNRATLGGNLQNASPIGDAAPCLLALDAALTLVSVRGTRRLPLRAFFRGYRQTALAPDELILSVHVPLPTSRHQRFYKVSKRVLDDIATVSAAFALDLAPDATIARLAVAYGGVAATPLHVDLDLARGLPFASDATSRALADAVTRAGTPQDDARGSAPYRRAMMGRLLEKFWHEVEGDLTREERAP